MDLQIVADRSERTEAAEADCTRRCVVHVLFTDIPATLNALRTAALLCDGLYGSIRLLLPEAVPFPLSLEEPRRNLRFVDCQFRTLVNAHDAAHGSNSVETRAEILLCRDAGDALRRRLDPESVVVIGKRSRWWPCREDRLASLLRAAGHHVVRTSALPRLRKGTARG